ncbi:helix-turn-helix domain-containing protein [Nannocystis sp. ILAH1]|uniref:helix-turn-helix domain-containing protein n=1 Tax=Nannocystis sp. ILAH1 TaxID=2996789 RepID=UPI002270C234|nr:helix-turn-helix domain-containing protein [Nannocystis sp. ILAH1]MCY0990655.1 helix-turn-helix domain-containing protein [Nannocystis sp. ILAH1]
MPLSPSQPPVPQLLTAEELAKVLRTSRKSVYALVERGQIPRVCIRRVGRLLRFDAHQVTLWLGSHGGEESAP